MSNTHGHHGVAIPTVVVFFVEIFCSRNTPFQFIGQIGVEHLQETHGAHIVQPSGIGLVYVFVFHTVGEDIVVGAAEEGVAGALDGGVDVQSAAVVAVNYVAADMIASSRAGIDRRGRDDVVLEGNQSVGQFESGTGGVGGLQSSVEERFFRIHHQFAIVFRAGGTHQQIRVIVGAGNQAQDLAGFGFNSHDGAPFAGHQLLAIALQLHVQSAPDGCSRDGHDVFSPIVVGTHLAVVYIHQHLAFAFHPAQYRFVGFLNAAFSNVVAHFVIVVVFHVLFVNFADVS